jgi:DNA-binding transcriptional ArsR family regulator
MNETEVFRALADPTRRAVLERLLSGEKNATELREGLGISQPAVSQHVAVLRGAGLIAERKEGRQVRYRLASEGLAPVFDWLGRYRAYWPARVERLKELLKEMDNGS